MGVFVAARARTPPMGISVKRFHANCHGLASHTSKRSSHVGVLVAPRTRTPSMGFGVKGFTPTVMASHTSKRSNHRSELVAARTRTPPMGISVIRFTSTAFDRDPIVITTPSASYALERGNSAQGNMPSNHNRCFDWCILPLYSTT